MRILALDAALDGCSAGVFGLSRPLVLRSRSLTSGAAEQLPLMLAELLAEIGQASVGLDALAVTVGPGSFSGIRTGLAAARALALAARLPVFPVTTFQALVAPLTHQFDDQRPLAAVIDARRGQLYVQHFSDRAVPLRAATVMSPQAAASALSAPVRLVGNGVEALRPHVRVSADIEIADVTLDAAAVALAAEAQALMGGEPIEATKLKPLYLREADARPDAGRALLAVRG